MISKNTTCSNTTIPSKHTAIYIQLNPAKRRVFPINKSQDFTLRITSTINGIPPVSSIAHNGQMRPRRDLKILSKNLLQCHFQMHHKEIANKSMLGIPNLETLLPRDYTTTSSHNAHYKNQTSCTHCKYLPKC
ncbi:hypothetical protein ACOSQ3_010265 [Xanthoceras sorbifolium]